MWKTWLGHADCWPWQAPIQPLGWSETQTVIFIVLHRCLLSLIELIPAVGFSHWWTTWKQRRAGCWSWRLILIALIRCVSLILWGPNTFGHTVYYCQSQLGPSLWTHVFSLMKHLQWVKFVSSCCIRRRKAILNKQPTDILRSPPHFAQFQVVMLRNSCVL